MESEHAEVFNSPPMQAALAQAGLTRDSQLQAALADADQPPPSQPTTNPEESYSDLPSLAAELVQGLGLSSPPTSKYFSFLNRCICAFLNMFLHIEHSQTANNEYLQC